MDPVLFLIIVVCGGIAFSGSVLVWNNTKDYVQRGFALMLISIVYILIVLTFSVVVIAEDIAEYVER